MASPRSRRSSNSGGSLSDRPPSLQQLVSHFVAAKRSLSATAHVWRANEIVIAARALLEENAVLIAQNAFVRSAVDAQIGQLRAVRHGIELVGAEAQQDFNAIIHALDASYNALHHVVDALQHTAIDAALQPPDAPPKSLYAFLDPSSIDGLRTSLKKSIDRTKAAERGLHATGASLDDSIASVLSTLPPAEAAADHRQLSPLPHLFHQLEDHATEAASALQSLVHHYDLCLTALKHTEGGFSAVQEAAASTGDAAQDNLAADLGSWHKDSAPPEPLTQSARLDMLSVITKDADEVDDVTAEIRDRLAEMEAHLSSMDEFVQVHRLTHGALLTAVAALRAEGRQLPSHLSSAKTFLSRWADEKALMQSGITEVEELRAVYSGFLDAYDELIVEVSRRRNVQKKMQRIAKKAQAEIERLYEEDLAQRQAFRDDHGEYLPADIWTGLLNPPPKYAVVPAPPDADDLGDWENMPEYEIPDIEKSVHEAAVKRILDRSGKSR